eukprot:scaffold1323_cov255-Pinguiococcus_pyrenoidosus.AAC.4
MPEGCDIPTCGWRAEGDARKKKKGKEKERKEKRSYRTRAAHSNSRGGAGGSLLPYVVRGTAASDLLPCVLDGVCGTAKKAQHFASGVPYLRQVDVARFSLCALAAQLLLKPLEVVLIQLSGSVYV